MRPVESILRNSLKALLSESDIFSKYNLTKGNFPFPSIFLFAHDSMKALTSGHEDLIVILPLPSWPPLPTHVCTCCSLLCNSSSMEDAWRPAHLIGR